jgi:hypothetical protein
VIALSRPPSAFMDMLAALEPRVQPGAAGSEIHGRLHWWQVARVGIGVAG